MTEKRFKIKYINEQHISANIYDDKTFIGSIGIGAELIVELLNSFNDENDVLKQQLKTKYIVNKQYGELQRLKQENEQLKQQINKLESQLYCPFDSICIQCNNEYLVQKEYYYVSKCKKGHEQCSRVNVKYCDDFELKGDVE